jgi:hypothetical protein
MTTSGCPQCGRLPTTMRSTGSETWYYCPLGHSYRVTPVIPQPLRPPTIPTSFPASVPGVPVDPKRAAEPSPSPPMGLVPVIPPPQLPSVVPPTLIYSSPPVHPRASRAQILGIISLAVLLLCFPATVVCGIIALIDANAAKRDIRSNWGAWSGEKEAQIGLVCAWVGLGIVGAVVLVYAFIGLLAVGNS